MSTENNHFAIVDILIDGRERLQLCELKRLSTFRMFPPQIFAKIRSEMHRVVGSGSFSQNVPTIESFKWLRLSPSRRYLATYAHEFGTTGFF